MRLVFDIDGTLCGVLSNNRYDEAQPYYRMIGLINDLYNNGHYIIIQTARGSGTNNGNVAKAYNQWYSITEKQLKGWGLKYHELHLGKPHGDIYIDDKAFRVNTDGSSVHSLRDFINEKEHG